MPEFAVVRKAEQSVLLRPEFQERILAILGLRGEAPSPSPSAARGRAGAYPAYDLGGGARGILKHYRHGGLAEALFGDLFFGLRRPFREFLASERARQLGVPTIPLLAARVKAFATLFYRGDVLLRELPGARDLGALLTAPPDSARARNRVVRAAARAVRRMHDAGLIHGDLNLRNLLVHEGPEGFAAYVVDLDQASFRKGPLPPAARALNLIRLGRSFLKLGGNRAQASLARRFVAAYCRGGEAAGRDRAFRRTMRQQLQTYPLSYHVHRIGWLVKGGA